VCTLIKVELTFLLMIALCCMDDCTYKCSVGLLQVKDENCIPFEFNASVEFCERYA
jgi:hypothetical protein